MLIARVNIAYACVVRVNHALVIQTKPTLLTICYHTNNICNANNLTGIQFILLSCTLVISSGHNIDTGKAESKKKEKKQHIFEVNNPRSHNAYQKCWNIISHEVTQIYHSTSVKSFVIIIHSGLALLGAVNRATACACPSFVVMVLFARKTSDCIAIVNREFC